MPEGKSLYGCAVRSCSEVRAGSSPSGCGESGGRACVVFWGKGSSFQRWLRRVGGEGSTSFSFPGRPLGLSCGQMKGQRAVGRKLGAGENESQTGSWHSICSAKEKTKSIASSPEKRSLRSTDVLTVSVLYHERRRKIRPFPNTKSWALQGLFHCFFVPEVL